MRQILQDLGSGNTIVKELPAPRAKAGYVLVQTITSLISSGTERMLVDFGRSGYLVKARQQPEKVRMVLDKVKSDGILPTVEAIRSKLDQPIPMGYSNVGRVLSVGEGVSEFAPGDIVVSNGNHADIVCVPKNLCARVPQGVAPEDAVFTVVGAIALQGLRLAEPSLGESFVVTGLGLIGLMTVQLLRAQGCRVLGLDFDASKLALAECYGAETVNLAEDVDPLAAAARFSRGRGVDGVLITASTKSNDPVHQAATMCRKRGRIILVGVTGLELDRADFYEKELSFQVSCSYGPGRYDPDYEEGGRDYPVGFVRWTEQRNFEAILDTIGLGTLSLDALKTKSFAIADAPQAYDFLLREKGALGVLLTYDIDGTEEPDRITSLTSSNRKQVRQSATLGAIGAGNYAGRALLPAFAGSGAHLKTIASSGGISGTHYGAKLGFEQSTTDAKIIFDDPQIDAVVIATQHDSHARFVIQALEADKAVFVEKPLALTLEELDQIEAAYIEAEKRIATPFVMVGFNRRFAPLVAKMKTVIDQSSAPISLVYTCNAGHVPADSWVHEPVRGGGRIVGEACHFIDLARFLAGSPIASMHVTRMTLPVVDTQDTATITLAFNNGSMASIHYFANGHRAFPKERIEVFQGGRVMSLDNFSRLTGYGASRLKSRSWKQNKGQSECCAAFLNALESGAPVPIPFVELMEVSRWSIEAGGTIGTYR